jgi:hypothetical protein
VPETSGRVYLLAFLGSWRDENRADLFERLLTANFYNLETNGATLAIDQRNHRVVLCYGHAVEDLDHNGFEGVISGFLDAAKNWKQRFAQFAADSAQTAQPAETGDGVDGTQFIRV